MTLQVVEQRTSGRAAQNLVKGQQKGPKDDVEWADLILEVARRQDRSSFGTLFAHFAPRVKALMMSGGLSEEAAEEIAQETLLAVWRKADQFDPVAGSASSWIYSIARNRRIDHIRRRGREVMTIPDADAEYVADVGPGPETMAAQIEAVIRVENAVAALTEDQVKVIKLSFFEERPHAEIARELKIPLGTVKSRLRLATKRLKTLLDDFK